MAEEKTFSTLVAEMEKEHAAKQPSMSTFIKSNKELLENQFSNQFNANPFLNPFASPFSRIFNIEEPAQPAQSTSEEKPIPPPDCPCHLKKFLEQNKEENKEQNKDEAAAQEFKFNQNAFSSAFFGIPSYNYGLNNYGYYGNSLNPFLNNSFANNYSFGSYF